jgi:hypothetical protein
MKNVLIIACLLFSINLSSFGQQISETTFGLGISKTATPDQEQHWNDGPSPTYLKFYVAKSWYASNKPISLVKDAGLNLQYANVNLESGGLGASNHLTGHVTSLFADADLLVRFRINESIALGIGPLAEVLIIGRNKLDNAYQTMLTSPPSAGNISQKGLNRDYFNQPSFGIKVSLFESMVDARTSIGLNFSYLWTKSEASDFYTTNYTRISFVIGFKKQKEEVIPDPEN